MRYIKEILKKNSIWVLVYIGLGIFNSFVANYKVDYFQKVIDGLADRTLAFAGVATYGFILLVNYCMNYLDNYPKKKLEHGIYLDFKVLSLRKISTIDYTEYQKIGTGKLVQRIENGSAAGRNVLFNFWLCLIRDLLPTIGFSIYFIWKIDEKVTYVLFVGYAFIFIITNILLKFLYKIKEKILNSEELLNHYLVRGYMEMLVFRMSKQFPSEIKKTCNAKEDIVSSKVKMNMIHEAFFTIFALLVAMLDIGILFYAWKTKNLTVGSVVALIALIENAYTPIAIFNVLYVQYKLDKASYKRFEEFLGLKDDVQLRNGNAINTNVGKIAIRNLSFQYEKRKIIDGLSLSIQKGEKIAFVGKNGEGKSTLVKMIMNEIPFEGELKIGHHVNIGYFAQNQADLLDPEVSVLDTVDRVAEGEIRKKIRDILGAFLFSGEEVDKKVKVLSGGERTRLAMVRLLLEPYNLLILDEPTNHLDMRTKDILKEALRKFEGTVIVVSHDRDFLTGLADKVYEFANQHIKEYLGGITDFLAAKKIACFREYEQLHKPKGNGISNDEAEREVSENKLSFEERKQLNKEIRKAEQRVERAEQRVTELESEVVALEKQMAAGVVNDELLKKYGETQKELEEAMTEWEKATEEEEEVKSKR